MNFENAPGRNFRPRNATDRLLDRAFFSFSFFSPYPGIKASRISLDAYKYNGEESVMVLRVWRIVDRWFC